MKSVILACMVTLGVDLAITEIWLDLRPIFIGKSDQIQAKFEPRCDMNDGVGTDFILLLHGKIKCVHMLIGQHRL